MMYSNCLLRVTRRQMREESLVVSYDRFVQEIMFPVYRLACLEACCTTHVCKRAHLLHCGCTKKLSLLCVLMLSAEKMSLQGLQHILEPSNVC